MKQPYWSGAEMPWSITFDLLKMENMFAQTKCISNHHDLFYLFI